MRTFSLGVLALLSAHFAHGVKVEIDDIDTKGEEPRIEGDRIAWGVGRFVRYYQCQPDETSFLLPNKRQATCCPVGTSLKGSADTEWHCCGEGHDLAGSTDVGFECCVEGFVFDGTECKRPDDVVVPPAKCESGLKTGMLISALPSS